MMSGPPSRVTSNDNLMRGAESKSKGGVIMMAVSIAISVIAIIIAMVALSLSAQQKGDIDRLQDLASSSGETLVASGDDDSTATPTLLSASVDKSGDYTVTASLSGGYGYWVAKSPLPSALSDMQAVAVGDMIYIAGGHDNENAFSSDFLAYDTALDTFNTSLPPLPSPRSRYAVAYLPDENQLLVVGGFKGETESNEGAPESCMLVYDFTTSEWTESDACLNEARGDFCAAEIGGKVYVAGGWGNGYNAVGSIEEYDPSSGEWQQVGELPGPRGDVACATDGTKLYVAGGYFSEDFAPTGFLKDLIEFDPATGDVTEKASMADHRGDPAMVALANGNLLVIGGESHARGIRTQVSQHGVEEYIVSEDIWISRPPIDTARFRFGAAHYGGVVYAFGGHITCPSADPASCGDGALDSVEALFTVDVAPIFVHEPTTGKSSGVVVSSGLQIAAASQATAGGTIIASISEGAGYWTKKPDLPYKLSDYQAIAVDDQKVLLIGGLDSNKTAQGTIIEFDAVLQVYNTSFADMPEPRYRFAAALLSEKIYITGGFVDGANDSVPAASVLVYDIGAGTWSEPFELITPRSDHCAAAVDGKVYIAGGYAEGYVVSDDVEVIDPVDGSSKLTTMPTPRGDLKCVNLDGSFVALGGYYDETDTWAADAFRTEVESYDPSAAEWTTLAAMPEPRGDFVALVLPGSRIIVFAGEHHARGEMTQVAQHDVFEYSAAANYWSARAPIPVAHFRAGGAYVDGTAYTFGGHINCGDDPDACSARALKSVYGYHDVERPDIFIYSNE